MRVVFIVICAALGVIAGYALFGNASAKTYLFDRLPAAVNRMFFSHDTSAERGEDEIEKATEGAVSAGVPDAGAPVDEEARLQQSIKSVEEEIRRTEEFLQKKNAH